ncbi:aspartate/glutamate racemase family protein [Sporomusa sp.]|uniref:aspartate/glutamate racemase family protein n=1 Tax=Sporomusa sp. TaxID=2078658 RepID=UPI002B59B59E|nr:aspartate/glutamate racemase family protein [Sporomusa sp.]HWR10097.1 aspartate/glutamate racemase family protein [Sporomusa sp.]
MKTIGLIGGLSWESSAVYYRIINELVRDKAGGTHSAKSIMYSVDFGEFEKLQHQGDWEKLTELMIDAGMRLKNGGADFIVICTNTMHKMAEAVESQVGIPVLHIADAAADEVKKRGLRKVALLGTKFTMEQDFYKGRLAQKHGIEVVIPDVDEREVIHSVIYHELVLGKILESSRQSFVKIIDHMNSLGAEGVVLGCTEIPLLIRQKDCIVPIFDTTQIHATAAVEFALR